MLKLFNLDFIHNKRLLLLICFSSLILSALILLNVYRIDIYNFDKWTIKRLTSNNTVIVAWFELYFPLIYSLAVLKIYSDAFSSSSLGFSLSLPFGVWRQVLVRNIFWLIMYGLVISLPCVMFRAEIIKNAGFDYLPHLGILPYALINCFILSSYVIFIQILFNEFYYSVGFLVIYILLDYFADGRFLRFFTLHSHEFRNYSFKEFAVQKLTLIFIALSLMAISVFLLSRSKLYKNRI